MRMRELLSLRKLVMVVNLHSSWQLECYYAYCYNCRLQERGMAAAEHDTE